jgi:hypothetical protein
MKRLGLVISILLFVQTPSFGATPLPEEEMSTLFRTLLLSNLPSPLIEKNFDWGKQRETIVGLKWKRDGILLKPETQKKMHNDGLWRRIRVDAITPTKSLQLGISDLKQPQEGKVTFTLNVNLPVQLQYEQQLWESGIKLYSGSTKARCKVGVKLTCEVITKTEYRKGSFLPDIVIQTKILDAKVGYDDFTVEHTLGVGGDAAKLLGEATFEAVRQMKPSLEKDLLVKGNAAIVKAGNNKEIRVGLSKLVQSSSKNKSKSK